MKPPRVLISYFFGDDTIPLGGSCARALQALGCEVATFDCRIEHRLQKPLLKPATRALRPFLGKRVDVARWFGMDNYAVRTAALRAAVAESRPDLLLILRGHHFEADFLAELKRDFGVTTAAWWLYGPEAHADLLPDVARYDHYFSIYRCDVPGVHTLPALAVDRALYHANSPREPFEHDIAFVGRHSERRDRIIAPLSDLPLSIWGAGWRKLKQGYRPGLWRRVAGSGIWGEALTRTWRRSKIVLNVSVWNPGEESGLNLRVFDVPACGGFLLTDHSPELAEFFTPGKEIETWSSETELRDKLQYYLTHDAEREKIALAGYARSLTLPDYTRRMRDMLEAMGVGL
jgi:spore maturation protein CgeB